MLPAALAFSVATSVKDIANYAALKNVQAFMRYFGKYPNDTSLADLKELFLPYRYGHATQVQFLNPVCYRMSPVSCGKHPDLQTCTCMQLLSSVYGLCIHFYQYIRVCIHAFIQTSTCMQPFNPFYGLCWRYCSNMHAYIGTCVQPSESSVFISHHQSSFSMASQILKAQLTGLLNGISHGPVNRKGTLQ